MAAVVVQRRRQEKKPSVLFAALDKDGDGKVSASELRCCMAAALGEDVSLEEAAAALASADADGDGLLDPAEFARLSGPGGAGAGEDEDEALCRRRCLREAFAMYAELPPSSEKTVITPGSLGRMLDKVLPSSSKVGVEECAAMIRRFDLDGDGVLSFQEFAVMMTAADG